MTESKGRILVVDDETGIRKILRMFLERDGYSVVEAVSANQAMELVVSEKPDLLILDVVLCGQTGFEVCEWIKNNSETSSTTVIIFSALNQQHDFDEAKRVKCDFYMTKPQNPKDIVAKVNEFFNKRVT